MKDYYGVLGLTRGAGEREIKAAYRKLAKQYHPDVVKGDKKKEARMYEIQEAYGCLGDMKQREQYDQRLEEQGEKGKQTERKQRGTPGEKAGPMPDMDAFERFFGFQAGKGMEYMKGKRTARAVCDGAILAVSALLMIDMGLRGNLALAAAAALCAAVSAWDLIRLLAVDGKGEGEGSRRQGAEPVIRELVLLDENNKPVRSWNLAGRVSVIIGRAGKEEDVDVDLEGCEYGAFVDYQHAALNYSLDRWYVEDLGSSNGVRVQKVEDGNCYRIMKRPCQVRAGDVLYIANTRLLLT